MEHEDIKDTPFTYTLADLKTNYNILGEVKAMFLDSWIVPMCNGNIYKEMSDYDILAEFTIESENNIIGSIGLMCRPKDLNWRY